MVVGKGSPLLPFPAFFMAALLLLLVAKRGLLDDDTSHLLRWAKSSIFAQQNHITRAAWSSGNKK